MSGIMVSVICRTYNHEKYIAQCLESLVSQKTPFQYEVLVHDDASTDRTAEIIRSFEKQYPHLIRPIYQKENQYSKGVPVMRTLLVAKAQGKYIAICEGDDYWTDPLKLKPQIDALERHPEIDMCTHGAVKVRDGKIIGKMAPAMEKYVFDAGDTIRGGGEMFATNSILYRKRMWESEPKFYQFQGYDYTLQIWGSLRGGILYLPEIMSAYRVMADGSWTSRMRNNRTEQIAHLQRLEQTLLIMKGEISDQYKPAVEDRLLQNRAELFMLHGNYRELRKPEYRSVVKGYSTKRKLILVAKQCFPTMAKKWDARRR